MPLYRTDMTEYKQRLKQQLIFRETNTNIEVHVLYIYKFILNKLIDIFHHDI